MAEEGVQGSGDAYLEAFMHGFEFVLLAIRGRIIEADLPPADRERLEAFIADYARIAKAYRAREGVKPHDGLADARVFKAEVTAALAN